MHLYYTKVLLFCMFIFHAPMFGTYEVVSVPSDTTMSAFTRCVQTRFYHIRRLEKVMHVFDGLRTRKRSILTKIPPDWQAVGAFRHDCIKQCVEQLKECGTVEPLFCVWHHIAQYKFIDQPELVFEFSKLLFFIIYHAHSMDYFTQVKYISRADDNLFIEKDADDIAFRFYLINRLSQPIDFLSTYEGRLWNINLKSELIQHPSIINCLDKIIACGNLQPFVALASQFNQFRYVDDPQYAKDFLLLLVILYKSFLQINGEGIGVCDGNLYDLLHELDGLVVNKYQKMQKNVWSFNAVKRGFLRLIFLCAGIDIPLF